MKRVFDFLLALIGIILILPILLLLAIAIKLDSRGPVFYRGIRAGRHRKPFRIFKFRSMVTNAESIGPSSTSDADVRITKIGRFMRNLKLDELPQFFNVLAGDMSFVGPRPQVMETAKEVDDIVFTVRPGITDWASVKFHNEGEIILNSGIEDADEAYMKLIHPEKTLLQIQYAKQSTLWVDLKILWQTFNTIVHKI